MVVIVVIVGIVVIFITVSKLIVVEIRQEVGFYVIDHILQPVYKSVEIFFVKENLVADITIAVRPPGAFRKCEVIIVAPRLHYIEKIGAFTPGFHLVGIHAQIALGTIVFHGAVKFLIGTKYTILDAIKKPRLRRVRWTLPIFVFREA